MARLIGTMLFVVAACLVLSSADGQEKKKSDFDVETTFKKLDTNNDGKLSKDEFLKLAERYKDKEKAREKLTLAFERIDPDSKGLSIEQFRKYAESVKRKDKTP